MRRRAGPEARPAAAPPGTAGFGSLSRHDALVLAALPCVVLIVFLVYPCRQFHWDTLERSYLLEHPGRYLHTWDGSPRSQFLSFAHVLELPLAAIVGALVRGDSGLHALVVFEAILAGATVFLLGLLVVGWRRILGLHAGAWRAAGVAQATLGAGLSFWKMGSSGEERILALATQLLFLFCFWRSLASPDEGAARSRPAMAWGVGLTLALAILGHLTGAVLVPFAAGALWLLPPDWRHGRARVARGVACGAILAGILYYAIAAWTTHVRGLTSLVDYLTFFHRGAGNNFWEPSGAAVSGPSRPARVWMGITAFFSGSPLAGSATVLLLAGILFAGLRRGGTAGAVLRRHALLLGGLWTLHFMFFEPQNFESWTLFAALLLLVAAASLPATRIAWGGFALPVLLLVANWPHYLANHRPMELERFERTVARQTQPGDIVVLVGGIQNNKPLSGGLIMRYFMANLRQRTLVSLYDVMGVTQPEYWGRPFASPAALQAAIDSGRHAFVPAFLRHEIDRANASGLVEITTAARGDSLLEITRIEGR